MSPETEKRFDCVGIGICPYDFALEVEGYPGPNTKNTAKRYRHGGGGPVPGALAALATLGCTTAMIGTVGDDVFGKAIVEDLGEHGVNVQGIRLSGDVQTLHAHILVDNQDGGRTVILNQNKVPPIRGSQLSENILGITRLITLDSRPSPAIIDAVKSAKTAGAKVMLDAGSVQPHVTELLPLVDYPIVTGKFVKNYFGHSNFEQACNAFLKEGAELAGVTMGAQGSYLATEDRTVYLPAFSIEAVDTTGAGDVYHGGVLYGILQSWSVKHIGQFASAVAALNSLTFGARDGLADLGTIREFFLSQGIDDHPAHEKELR